MPSSKLPAPHFEDLCNKIDKLGKSDKMELLQDLCGKVRLSKADWQELAPKKVGQKLCDKIDKIGKEDKLKLFQQLGIEVNLSEDNWKELAPFLIPKKVRKKLFLLHFPWELEDRQNLGLLIKVRICLQDPSFIRNKSQLGINVIEVGWEPGLTDGPTSARISVEDDYTTKSGTEQQPLAKWHEKKSCFMDSEGKPLDPRLNNPQFRQVNAWAIAKRILEFYEDPSVLGRSVPWGFNGNRLIIKPHAMDKLTETYYNTASKSLEFGFSDTVFACLSHDIVAHETGHAVLDGIRPFFYDSWTLETAAFHEFIADLTAIMSALRHNYVRNIFTDFLEKNLPEQAFLARIGEEFGHAIDKTRNFVRTAENKDTMENVRKWEKECPPDAAHNSSQVLTGLIYDLLLKLYQGYRRKNKPRAAAWYTTRRLFQMALQPLDFLPPVDVTFSDYVEAFLFRDKVLFPEYRWYRQLFRELCQERDFKPPPEGHRPRNPRGMKNPDVDGLLASRTSAYTFIHANRAGLFIPANRDVVVDVYAAEKVDSSSNLLPQEIIVQYMWKEDFEFPWEEHSEFKALQGRRVPLLCGGTLVFDENANFQYWVHKPGTEFQTKGKSAELQQGQRRQQELKNYVAVSVVRKDEKAIRDLLSGRFATRK